MTASLHEYVTRQAERRGDAIAIAMGDERVTYAELEGATNQLARMLVEAGCSPGDRVALFLPKSPAAILGMLGVLKAGGAYVPIDLGSPAARVAKVVRAAEPQLCLASHHAAVLLDELHAASAQALPTIVSLDEEPVEGRRYRSSLTSRERKTYSEEPLGIARSSSDLAHILFTSGSTGDPKGVKISHANVIAFVEWAASYFGMGPSDRISGHPPLHFDLSTFDIYGTFSVGAELHQVPPDAHLLPHRLADLIRKSELTQWFSVPSILTYMAKFDAVRHGDFPSLERLLWCGEVLPTSTLRHWMQRLPSVSFTNLYGPTEATIASSYYTVPQVPGTDVESIPIGSPCAGEELLVLDDELAPAPVGEPGQLYIGGVGLSSGYWRDEDKTRAAFVPDPRSPTSGRRIYKTGDLAVLRHDGMIDFLGRADSQIKSRGYRIELGEIEAALNALGNLKETAVVGIETNGFEGVAICCAYAPMIGADLEPALLRSQLRSFLPTYMLPSRWMALETLPKNVNGKIDRRRIKDLFGDESAGGGAQVAR
jgi:amino acid adenylation domain-containing protein